MPHAHLSRVQTKLPNTDIEVAACQGTAMHNPFKGFGDVNTIAPELSTKEEIYLYVRTCLILLWHNHKKPTFPTLNLTALMVEPKSICPCGPSCLRRVKVRSVYDNFDVLVATWF
jgi:hypothetical protein